MQACSLRSMLGAESVGVVAAPLRISRSAVLGAVEFAVLHLFGWIRARVKVGSVYVT